jgi:hypothetical protein
VFVALTASSFFPPNRGVDFYFEFFPAKIEESITMYFEFLPAKSNFVLLAHAHYIIEALAPPQKQ